MAGPTDVLDNITMTPGTPGNSFELALDVKPLGSNTYVNFPDITNLNPTPTEKVRSRETYAAKGVERGVKYAEVYTVTVSVEIVRDAAGKWQPYLADIMRATQAKGALNRRTIRWYDVLGADYTAYEMEARVLATYDGTDWDSSKWVAITFVGYGPATPLAVNPATLGVVPVIGQALPAARAVGGTVVISGDNFTGVTGATGVKVGATNATSYEVLDDGTITFVMPAGAAGPTTITVTHPTNGASTPLAYQRGA